MKLFFLSLLVAGTFSAQAVQVIAPDAKEITVKGCRYLSMHEGLQCFSRFHAEIGKLPPKDIGFNWLKGQTTTGIRIVFKTDSPKVKLNFKLQEEASYRGTEFGVFINDEWHQAYLSTKKEGLDLEVVIESGSAEMKKYEVTLPSFSNPALKNIEIAEGSKMEKAEEEPQKCYVAIGDSITHGQGQGSATQKTYPYLLSKKLNLDLYNLAVGGGKISLPVAKQLKDWKKIDLMTILIGYNDWCFNGKTVEQYQNDYREFLKITRSNHPNTKIYCITMLYTKTEKSKKSGLPLPPFRKAVEDLVNELQQAGDKNVHLVKGDEITSIKNLQTDKSDPVHLSVEGASLLAEELSQLLYNQR